MAEKEITLKMAEAKQRDIGRGKVISFSAIYDSSANYSHLITSIFDK